MFLYRDVIKWGVTAQNHDFNGTKGFLLDSPKIALKMVQIIRSSG